MSASGLLPSSIATVAVDSFLFGAFALLSGAAFYLLVERERTSESGSKIFCLWRNPMVIPSILLTICATANWILVVYRSFAAFIYSPKPLGPLEYYANLADVSEVVKTAFAVTTLLTFDAVMVYRLWIIWNRNYVTILFPGCCLLAEIAGSIGTLYAFATYEPEAQDVFSSSLGKWISTATILTLPINLSCASLIAWRLWRAHVQIEYHHSSLLDVLVILVESAALYVAWTIAFIAVYQSRSNVQFFIIDTYTSITGIAFMLINVRVWAGWSKHGTHPTAYSTVVFASGSTRVDSSTLRMRTFSMSEVGGLPE